MVLWKSELSYLYPLAIFSEARVLSLPMEAELCGLVWVLPSLGCVLSVLILLVLIYRK